MQTLTVHQNFEFLKTVLQSSSHPKYPEGSQLKRACVFLLMKNTENREILTILKSDNPGYAWRNQIALPGGHVDRTDDSPLDTAFRELEEELGIKPENVRFVVTLDIFQPSITEIFRFLREFGMGKMRSFLMNRRSLSISKCP